MLIRMSAVERRDWQQGGGSCRSPNTKKLVRLLLSGHSGFRSNFMNCLPPTLVFEHASHQTYDRIQWAGRASRRHFENVRVNHCGADIRVAQQFLHRADVGSSLQKMSGK